MDVERMPAKDEKNEGKAPKKKKKKMREDGNEQGRGGVTPLCRFSSQPTALNETLWFNS